MGQIETLSALSPFHICIACSISRLNMAHEETPFELLLEEARMFRLFSNYDPLYRFACQSLMDMSSKARCRWTSTASSKQS